MIGPRSGQRRRTDRAATFSDVFVFVVSAGAAAPADAREQLVRQIDGKVDTGTLETARLLISELVTNCVQHSGVPSGGPIEVSGSLPSGSMRLEVWSDGDGFERPEGPRAAYDDERGRGLVLVDALSAAWGVSCGATRAGVWCELDRNSEGDPLPQS